MSEQSIEKSWFMLTLVGRDQPGIVAQLTTALFEAGCHLGEASMMRLGGNFTIMLMVSTTLSQKGLTDKVNPVSAELNLQCHIDEIEGSLHDHRTPDVRVSVYGADRAGIVSQITSTLANAGFDVFDLESDVAGSDDQPIYIMHMEGHAANGIEALQQALTDNVDDDIKVTLTAIDTLIG